MLVVFGVKPAVGEVSVTKNMADENQGGPGNFSGAHFFGERFSCAHFFGTRLKTFHSPPVRGKALLDELADAIRVQWTLIAQLK